MYLELQHNLLGVAGGGSNLDAELAAQSIHRLRYTCINALFENKQLFLLQPFFCSIKQYKEITIKKN